jgi:hypothetical protein
VEGASSYQTLNDQAIPGSSGTRFSLSEISRGPFSTYRVYLGHSWDRHELRALYAPLSIDLTTRFDSAVNFMGASFAPATNTSAFYRFNSYRLTYTYFLMPTDEWEWGWGFTGKIRDAEVRLTQGDLRKSKTSIGFVPLLHLQGRRTLGGDWIFRLDFDGLVAPQGRAFDVGVFLEKQVSQTPFSVFGGYRTVEGGADNGKVYNFAWFHSLTLGARGEF